MKHATHEQLLALRDGDAGASWAARHVEHCELCRNELKKLEQMQAALRALPSPRPPRDLWPVIRERVKDNRHRQARIRLFGGLAIAATLALLLVGGLQWRERALERQDLEAVVARIELLQESSELLEDEYLAMRPRERVLQGWQAAALSELEDQLLLLERDLAQATSAARHPAETEELWLYKLELQGAMVDVHLASYTARGL